ncbi:DNA polymerase III subunit delta [Bathymodiolus japonicus methanotrophic gill symbiont]|uniref:DNA polymerase III subunit delta n=1 Tax=Bathymodiolus japonicus methanotrophic gill symbiont TaxID=113269 RepID=UPI001B4ACAC9|nr:DNA polymerase III subunit delta [Bathymodiolus japonicus methanotrophic gill symbiont]GFO72071.1 DNA polymerase III subunit delta [Bathymodiolus japonicus methanotrophic gill symbiont]
MWLKVEQLTAALARKLAPIYFISGDELLQSGEAADAVRLAAKNAGYENRELLTVDRHFNWGDFLQSADSLSIFSDKKIIDLRMPSGKPGMEGSKALVSYCERLPEDTLLLITSGKVDKSTKKSKWLTTLEKHGVVLQVWPLEGTDLAKWIGQRMQRRGLSTDSKGLGIISSRVEGNLLAASQEVEKLYVLYGQGKLTGQQIAKVVTDASRYDVFNLVDAALSGRVDRVNKILLGVQHEGIAAPVVLWALSREIRSLISIQQKIDSGQPRNRVFMQQQVWDKRQKVVNDALARLSRKKLMNTLLIAARADRQIKGEQLGDCWESFLEISLELACT